MARADEQTPIYAPAPRAWIKGPKRPRGRPTKRSKERDEGIVMAILVGFNLKATAAANGITYQTLRAWIKEDPSFGRVVERARASAEQARKATLRRLALQARQPGASKKGTDKTFYHAYIHELSEIVYKQDKANNLERLNAALIRNGLDPFPADS
jgi:hypothetical protein